MARQVLRLGSGIGLLLLIAAEERVCPWLESPEETAPPVVAEVPGQSDPGPDDESDKRPRLTLATSLPDVALPRRSVSGRQVTLQTSGRRDVGAVPGNLDGPSSAGDPGSAAAARVCGFRLLDCLTPVDASRRVPCGPECRHDLSFAIGSTILRQGPPSA